MANDTVPGLKLVHLQGVGGWGMLKNDLAET